MTRSLHRRFVLVGALAGALVTGLVGRVPVALATTIAVTTTADQFGGGAGCSLREAIKAANDDAAFGGCPAGTGSDAITLPSGTYVLSIAGTTEDLTGQGDLDIRSDLSIAGDGAATTTVDGGGIDRVFQVDPATSGITASMSGVTVTGGTTVGETGGGIRNHGTLNLADVAITGNQATTSDGGGIHNQGGTIDLSDSSVSGNTSGEDGGGIRNATGPMSLTNVTISGNSAVVGGGGIQMSSGTLMGNNVTITGNTADSNANGSGDGGGINPVNVAIELSNTILAGNTDASPLAADKHPDCSGTVTSAGYNLLGDDTGCTLTASTGDKVGTGAAPIDPKLGPLADNGGPTLTHALMPGSPAIDAGNPTAPGSGGSACAATDQRGAPRNCDIGAYELVRCKGTVVNRVGTGGDDVLAGTGGGDGFLGQGGNDRATGLGGNDAACMGGGKDTAAGGGGKDRLLGEAGKDKLKGQGGKDRLKGGPGKDTCVGGTGRDKATCEKETSVP